MNWPAMAAIWLTPSAKPRCSAGNASVRIEPPTAWSTRQPISHSAPWPPSNGSNDSSTDANAKTAKPAL
jgi:hypothetical protein